MFITNTNLNKSGNWSFALLILLIIISGIVSVANASYVNLHNFTGVAGEEGPHGSLTFSDDKNSLYGMTYGDSSSFGVIFKVDADGSDYTLLHTFTGGSSDGKSPMGSLTLSGGWLYGMTYKGGTTDDGVIFKIDTAGNNFTLLHSFNDADTSNGNGPYGSLILSDGWLYGMTRYGGDNNYGVIFKIDINGSNYDNLHEFSFSDGLNPYGDLLLSGGWLYGMTYRGGDHNKGVIFKIDTAGGNFALLHSFAGGSGDGKEPYGLLILSEGCLYGMTRKGGLVDLGVIFKIDTDGSNYDNLHEFAGNDGDNPRGSLTLSGGSLYGMTFGGGDELCGVIFQIGIDGNNYTILHNFAGKESNDGEDPYFCNLINNSGDFYGMTRYGGGANDYGMIFKLGTQASSIVFDNTGDTSVELSWDNGIGDDRLVVCRSGAEPSGGPVDETVYAADNTFGDGDSLGDGYVVYNNSGSAVAVDGLTANTKYYFQVFDYYGDTEPVYNTDTAINNPNSITTTPEPGMYFGIIVFCLSIARIRR